MRSRLMANRLKISAWMRMVSANCGTMKGSSALTVTTARKTARWRIASATSLLLAEQPAGPHHQDEEHQEVHQRQRQVLEVVRAEHLDERDQQAADDRAQERAHAADDDDHEGVDHDRGAHAEERRDQGGG